MLVTSSLVVAGLDVLAAGYMLGMIITNGGGGPFMLASFILGVALLELAWFRHLRRV